MLLDSISHTVSCALPYLDLAFVLFLLGQKTAPEVALYQFHLLECFINNAFALRRDGNISNRKCSTGPHGIFKAKGFDLVCHFSGLFLTTYFIYISDQVLYTTFVQFFVNELNFFRQDAVEENAANCCVDDTSFRFCQA